FRINGSNKSANLSINDIRIGMESDLPNGINRIKISSNEISLVGNNLGSPVSAPTNLFIKGQMIYDDGNQQSDYILQCDGSGAASWVNPTSIANDNDWVLNGSDIYNANSGNIGIGTNNPDDKLHIHDPGNTQVKIESSVNGLASLELDAANTKASVDFYNNGTWAGTMGFDVDDNFLFWQEDGYGKILTGKDGKIGIGTSSPSSKFHVEDGAVLFDGTSGSTPTSGNGRRFMWIPNKQAIRAGSVIGTEWDNANIGIGSAAFGQNNTASGSNSTSFGQANSATGIRSLAGGVSSEASGNGSTALGEYASAEGRAEFSVGAYPENSGTAGTFDVMFEVGNGTSSVRNSAFVVNYDGSVGIGTTSTDALLDVDINDSWTQNSIYGQKIEIDKQSSGVMYGIASYLDRNVSGYTVGIYSNVDNDGTSSFSTFALNGYADGNSTGAKYGVFGSTGPLSSGTKYGVYCSGNGAYSGTWSAASDLKFKENIDEYEGALEDLMKLQTKTYFFKNSSEYAHMNFSKKLQYGLIAQEVEEIFPELVEDGVHPGKFNEKTNLEGEPINYKAMNYIGLIPVLIQSIQEQQEMIEELKKEIENLKNK
ncbi:MAG: tail fiber domain-containing protein, partial [Bacteroidota bacterium]|nr:tail fiber domain-containing protein [Bacteroidota bacterium]